MSHRLKVLPKIIQGGPPASNLSCPSTPPGGSKAPSTRFILAPSPTSPLCLLHRLYPTSAPQTYLSAGGGIAAEYTPKPRLHIRASVGERYVLYRPIIDPYWRA